MSVISNNQLAGSSGQGGADSFSIDKSLRFNSGDSAHLSRTPSSAGNRRTWTISFWFKKVKNDSSGNFYRIFGQAESTHLYFTQDALRFDVSESGTNSAIGTRQTSQVFRDNSAWMHCVAVCDTTAGTASERLRLYINGSEVTQFDVSSDPSQNADTSINTANIHTIGYRTSAQGGAGGALDAYLADVHFIDGQALAASDFGEFDSNNVWQPKAFSGSYGTNGFHLDFSTTTLGEDSSGNNNDWTANNLTVPNDAPKGGFDVVTWTANGSNQSITGLGFQPDLVWAKSRNTGSTPHLLVDSVRGVSQSLSSHATSAEEDYSGISGVISAFNSDGFDTGGNSDIATNGRTFVGWAWKAGGTASSNTDGSITSSVSANSTYGFSIVSYTGNGSAATIGHGLDATPQLIIKKFRSISSSWDVYHASAGAGNRLVLNTDAAAASTSSYASVNSSTFDVHAGNNDNGETAVAYCWSEVPGFSKFGTFTHTNATQTLTLGFKPKFFLFKRTDSTGDWFIYDSERDSFDNPLYPNKSDSEGSGTAITALSDGLTWSGGSLYNGDYIYAAFAASPDGKEVDALTDTPTENFATLNPLQKGSNITLSNGNLDVSSSGTNNAIFVSTIGVTSGKWYVEFTRDTGNANVGITNDPVLSNGYLGQGSGDYAYYSANGRTYNNGSFLSYGDSWGTGDVIGIAFDADAGTLHFYKNGVVQNSGTAAFTGLTSGPYFFGGGESGQQSGSWNFGQRAFAYTPPTGFNALSTENLPTPTIAKGSTAFDAVTYSGNGTTQTITGINHSPDFVWIKCRNDSIGHQLFDQVRGAGKSLLSNTTEAERTNHIYGYLSAFTSDGFTVTAGSSDDFEVNGSTETYVAWNWDAGTSTVSNTDGSVTSSVRANPSAGFSIVNYTGTGSGITVGHGLNSTPVLYIQKDRDATESWRVYTTVIDGSLDYLLLHDTSAKVDSSYTAPTSSVFNIGGPNNDDHIVYCFAPVEGFSAFGTYTGNGTSDSNAFVYTGFRPKWLMVKNTTNANDWWIYDTTRNPSNYMHAAIDANNSNAELDPITNNFIDALSNGFKIRGFGNAVGASGDDYLYMAFAEHPFKHARAR